MTINYSKIERVMDMMRDGYNGLPEDTKEMKERKENLIILVDTVQDEIISKNGINNVTMETVYDLQKKAREEATEVCDNKCHVYGWLTSELYERYGL